MKAGIKGVIKMHTHFAVDENAIARTLSSNCAEVKSHVQEEGCERFVSIKWECAKYMHQN